MFMTRPTFALSVSVGLQPSQVHARLTAEQQRGFRPVRYENQYLRGYHWWIFPNYVDNIYSKVYARLNIFGDLVVGRGAWTRLVCIKNGRLTLSPFISEDVVSASDERLLVCL
ncbi:hypothetical protein C6499_22600 [Candidatus Poribacteria bacterium]|nr:MAG: hypothetical protein C6499_22600 [Candidatus Poribacteria bacterium]